jgi:hypothetical protein
MATQIVPDSYRTKSSQWPTKLRALVMLVAISIALATPVHPDAAHFAENGTNCCPAPGAMTCDDRCCEGMPGNWADCTNSCLMPPKQYPEWKGCAVAVGCSMSCCESASGSIDDCMKSACCSGTSLGNIAQNFRGSTRPFTSS